MGKKCKDHKGNEYQSQAARALAYGLNDPAIQRRLKAGWTLEKALTTPLISPELHIRKKNQKCKDHKGNEYLSDAARARAYGLNDPAVKRRLKAGWDLEKALTTPLRGRVYDHKGNRFANLEDMVLLYGISKVLYHTRKRSGWTLEKILTTPICRKTWVDPNGKEYTSYKKMCKANNVSEWKFYRKYKAGCSIQDCMDDNVTMSSGECKIAEYLKKMNMDYKFNCSIASIWTDCLDSETRHLRIDFVVKKGDEILAIEFDGRQHFERNYRNGELAEIAYRDAKKTKFLQNKKVPFLRIRYTQINDITEILDDFILDQRKYIEKHNPLLSDSEYYRIRDDLGEEKQHTNCTKIYHDHKGLAYPTQDAMCRAYGKSRQAVKWRLRTGKSLEEALETPVEATIYDDNGNIYHSISDICRQTKMGRVKAARVVAGEIEWSEAKKQQVFTDHHKKTYDTFAAMCRQYGKSVHSVKRRLSQGYDIEYALTCPPGPNKNKYEINGKYYANLQEVAKAIGISYYTLNARRKEGMTLDEISETKGITNKVQTPKHKYFIEGKGFSSLAAVAKEYKKPYAMLTNNLKLGLSLQEAIVYTPPSKIRPSRRKSYEIDGIIYHSISEVAKKYNIPATRLSKHIKENNIKDAINKVKEEITIYTNEEGKAFRTYREIAEYYNVSYNALMTRCQRMSISEAVKYRRLTSISDHNGQQFSSKREMAEHWGITPKALEGRLDLGWELQRALTTPMHEYVEDHEGRKFQTKKEMCAYYGIDPKVVRNRLKKSWSLKDALTLPTNYKCIDIYGNEFSSSKEMCSYYEIDYSTYRKLLKNNVSEREAFSRLIQNRDKRREGKNQ